LAALGAGGKAGEPVAVEVGEPQVRTWRRPFLADNYPHPGGHAPHCRYLGRPPALPPDGLVIESGGPLAADTAGREGRPNTVKVLGCATVQGSETEDRGRAPAELAKIQRGYQNPTSRAFPMSQDYKVSLFCRI
jgi:hypothetical protein